VASPFARGTLLVSDRIEFWWIRYAADVQPAEVTFRGGIPVHGRVIGSRELIAAASIELLERLPAAPKPALGRIEAPQPRTNPPSSSPLWLIGIIVLTLVYWFSGYIFDALK
jgi:hypothetical protein